MTIPAELAPYLDELVEHVEDVVDLEAAYVIGSAASGAFEPGHSDLDVYAVTRESLPDATKQDLVERIEALECPAVRLRRDRLEDVRVTGFIGVARHGRSLQQ